MRINGPLSNGTDPSTSTVMIMALAGLYESEGLMVMGTHGDAHAVMGCIMIGIRK